MSTPLSSLAAVDVSVKAEFTSHCHYKNHFEGFRCRHLIHSMAISQAKTDGPDTHRVALRGSAKLVSEFFEYSINTILFQRGVYPAEDFTPVKKYGLNMLVSSDDQVKAYIKKIMSQLNKWMVKSKISKFVVVISSKETGEHVERWQFDVQVFGKGEKRAAKKESDENAQSVVQTTI